MTGRRPSRQALARQGHSLHPDPHDPPPRSPESAAVALSRLTRRLTDATAFGKITLTAQEAHVYLAALAYLDEAAARHLGVPV